VVRGRFGFLMGLEGTHLHVLSLTKIKVCQFENVSISSDIQCHSVVVRL
jgi:hypothetical protein